MNEILSLFYWPTVIGTLIVILALILVVLHLGRKNEVKLKVPTHGQIAHIEGFKLQDNPFRQHTAEHSIWRDDWLFSAGRFK